MAANGFAPTDYDNLICTDSSQSVTVTGPTVLVTNVGHSVAYINIDVTATTSDSIALLPNTSIFLTADTQISAIGSGAILNIVSGT